MEEGDKVSDCVLQTQIGNSSEQLIVVISATVLWFRDYHYDTHQFCKSLLSQRILKGPNELMYLELFLLAYRVLYTFKVPKRGVYLNLSPPLTMTRGSR